MKTYEQLFNEYMILKNDIQSLSSIVQNTGTKLTEDELLEWLNQFSEFRNKLDNIRLDTVRVVLK